MTPRASSGPTTRLENAWDDASTPRLSPVFRAWLDSAAGAPTDLRLTRHPIAPGGAARIGVWISSQSAD